MAQSKYLAVLIFAGVLAGCDGRGGTNAMAATRFATSGISEDIGRIKKLSEGELIAQLQAKVTDTLMDPGSAQFRDFKLNDAKSSLCGEINFKSGRGHYVGFRPFVATEGAAVIWNGGKCASAGGDEAQMACRSERHEFVATAVNAGCKTQAEIDAEFL